MPYPSPRLPKTDPPLRHRQVFGQTLTFTDEGSESEVLFAVHGVPGSVRDFRYLAPQILPFSRLIRVNLPGSGGSAPRRDALRSLEARAETVLRLADELGISGFGVIGHSMGAGTALVTASLEPARVTRLALIAPMGLRPHRALSRTTGSFKRMAQVLRAPFLGQLLLPHVRNHYKARRFPGADEMTAQDFAIQFEAFSAADYPLLNRAVARGLPERTLVAYAEDDHLVESQIPIELAAAIPGARALGFETGGHIIQKTRAVEIAQAIREL